MTSTPEAISVGVPQGSILGPLLFILHINNLPEVVSECNILMYADDTVIYCLSSKASVIQGKLIANLSKIEQWLSFNSLFINVTKTEALLFGNSFSITLNNNVIKRVFHFTYLGIVFDDRLSWDEQIKQLISRAGKRVGMLGRLRRSLAHKHGLEALQNQATRIAARTVRSNLATDVLKWPTLEERRRKTVFKLVKKCLQGQCQYLVTTEFIDGTFIHLIAELAERSPIIIQISSNPSSRKNLDVQPYDRTRCYF